MESKTEDNSKRNSQITIRPIKSIKLRENSIFHDIEDNNTKNEELNKNERLSRNYLNEKFHVKKRFFCTICDKLLKQPVQSDCGCRFCEKCYDQHFLLRSDKCPTKDCGKIEIKNKYRDRAIEKEMEKFPISCINDNCKVDMYLSFLYTHLQYCPESLCYCNLCFSKILLKNKNEHKENDCINRKIQCKFCLKEMSVYEAKNYHFNVVNISEYCEKDCGKCPYKCSPDIHNSIKFHLINEHGDKFGILKDNTEIEERLSVYKEKINLLENSMTKFQRKSVSVKKMKLEIENINFDLKDKIGINDDSTVTGSRYIWSIIGFSNYYNNAKSNQQLYVLSPPFYTEDFGYKIYLKIYPFGDGIAKGNHLSLFIAIAKGKYDPLLQWPFKHKFKLQILNQNNNKNHTECFRPDSDSACYHRPLKDINVATGNPKFISFEKLFENNGLIKDDSLMIHCEIYK